MRLKSFFADTIEEAIQQAHREMGPEAMLINSKRAAPEARHLGAYEVVCAAGPEPQSAAPASAGNEGAPHTDRLLEEVSALKQQMERLSLALARSGGMSGIASDPDLSRIFMCLTEAELDADLAYDVVAQLGQPASSHGLATALKRLVSVAPGLGSTGTRPQIVALVGPPGSGKTTTLVKLAARHGIASRKAAQILSMDTYRIGAAEELRSYAAILGVGFQLLESTAALVEALEEHRQRPLILIDTPGLAAGEIDALDELARFFSSRAEIETHLVLPASMRANDLRRAARSYQAFQPAKLLFTRLDETETFGPIINQSVRMKKPVSFLSYGQRIPEDLEAASEERIVDLILKSQSGGQPKFGTVAA